MVEMITFDHGPRRAVARGTMRITSSLDHSGPLPLRLRGGCRGHRQPPPTPDGGRTTAKLGKQNYIANVHAIAMRLLGRGLPLAGRRHRMYGLRSRMRPPRTRRSSSCRPWSARTRLPRPASSRRFGTLPRRSTTASSTAPPTSRRSMRGSRRSSRTVTPAPAPRRPPLVDAAAKLRTWSGCMKIADFNTAQMRRSGARSRPALRAARTATSPVPSRS